MEKFLEGKGAFITGAGAGFGREMALRFAEVGANLALNDIALEPLEETAKLAESKYGSKVFTFKADISKPDEVKAMTKEVFKECDNIFVLVNNAGIDGGLYRTLACPIENYDKVMDVNVKGSWLVTKNFFRKMRLNKFKPIAGKIINIASCAGVTTSLNPFIGIYSVSKAALIALTKLWALELAPKMTCNAISPGVFLTAKYHNDPNTIWSFLDARKVGLPLKRIGMPADVASAALFLASPGADYITGDNMILDGGMTTSINKL